MITFLGSDRVTWFSGSYGVPEISCGSQKCRPRVRLENVERSIGTTQALARRSGRRDSDKRAVDVAEQSRLNDAREEGIPWKKWGPYLSERQWGTVREDYSADGNAWDYFTHDQSRSRAYRWGEDGLGGISDDEQRLCFALALWNERDPILKERLFGLTNSEGNHGEDVKEYYFYVDSTPTHSYMKYLYKYPQREFPYRDLVETNRRRSREEFEYELLDTGIFDDDRYFDVFLEYAKEGPDDILIRDHGPQPRARGGAAARPADALVPQHLVVGNEGEQAGPARDAARRDQRRPIPSSATIRSPATASPELLFTENESNAEHLWGQPNATPYVKDAFHHYVSPGAARPSTRSRPGRRRRRNTSSTCRRRAPRSSGCGSRRTAPASRSARLRCDVWPRGSRDADEFYDRITPRSLTEDERRVHRQALAGMLWTKQYYYFDVDTWLKEHEAHPLLGERRSGVRNAEWFHMFNGDIISMPDKWEYPWYAAWDLAFHTLALSLVDFDFAKEQLLLMLRSLYSHPNGQIPAYEWNFSDVNPPVHAWATLFLYKVERGLGRRGHRFPGALVPGPMLNFNWWVNRKDPRAATSSPAASSASTTSASSTAARRSRPAGRSSRPTAPPGWPSTARTCWRSR